LARQKSRTKQKLFSAGSELRKGYTMPTIKKIRSVLMSRSKTFLVNLIITMMAKKSKTEKIRILIKIEKGKIVRKVKRRKKAKSTRKGQARKTARPAYKKKAKNGRKKPRTAKQKAATRKLVALNKRRKR
jgi:hypothetical protein